MAEMSPSDDTYVMIWSPPERLGDSTLCGEWHTEYPFRLELSKEEGRSIRLRSDYHTEEVSAGVP